MDPLYSPWYEQYMNASGAAASEKQLLVDAHVLSTPVLVDIDNDKHMDIIIPVTYYFDRYSLASMTCY
jgi:hypothetical protein